MRRQRMVGRFILAMLCVMALALSNATAATLYVSSSAGAGGDGSEASPFNTVAAAVSALNEGDVILLEKGSTFNETLYWPATTSTFNLTIGTYGSGDAPIWTPGNSSSGRLKVIECQRVLNLDGIDFRMYNGQAFDALKLQGGWGHNISNCTFTDAAYCVAAFYLPQATFTNCKFVNGYFQMAIVQAGVTLDNCEFTGTAVYPVSMVYGSTVTVQDCYFHDLNSASTTTGLIGAKDRYANPQVLTVTGSVFYNNMGYVHLNYLGDDFTATFTNNTAYVQEKSFVRDNNTGKDSQVTAKNNIFAGTTSTTFAVLLQLANGSYADLVSDYNLFYDNPFDPDVNGADIGANSLVDVDPLFLSTTPGDPDFLRIGINSPAATAGEGGTYMGAYAAPTTEAPVFDPASQYIFESTPITITCSTAGASIYYTTDGSTPTTSSNLYAGPITVANGTTLNAIAVSAGLLDSAVTSQTYIFYRPTLIYDGSATVDGDLSEWADAEWTPVDQDYYMSPTDVAEAYYAAKWSSDKVYIAVKVRDTSHVFTDSFDDWNTRDAVELYLHTNGSSADYKYADSEAAQQLSVGIMNSDPEHDAVWAELGYQTGALPASYVCETAGQEDGEWLYYEASMTSYEYMGGFVSQPNILCPLAEDMIIGLDVVVPSYNSGNSTFGMKSENLMLGKSGNYTQFSQHKLAVSALIPGDANGDGAVDVGDLGILAANYGTTSGATWVQGDFNGDGAVDVGDLGILAANYGTGSSGANWDADYAKVFDTEADEIESDEGWPCVGVGLPLIAGLLLVGLMLVKLED